ncbi:MAG: FAD-dependent oxidoreductase, partial [Lachnospiraceae bacterium]|nr:FAD-dependent oxidoreductase [Lachnospiraceae bacterium]
ILYESKPHIGTDILSVVVANMRNRMIGLGAEFRYRCRLDDIKRSSSHITAYFDNGESIDTDALVLAIGHSARDTFNMLYDKGIPMSVKDFAVGLRVLHPKEMIDASQYGPGNLQKGLGAANYKLTYTSESGRGVYSFCMCPGGYVVNASSIKGQTAVNGMSYSKRDNLFSNSGIIVSVGVKDYGSDDALAGMRFQTELEKKAYELGSGSIPVQTYDDYISGVKTISGISTEGFKGDIHMTDMSGLLPPGLRQSLIEGMSAFDRTIPGFAGKETVLAGIESRTSSPVRIHRGPDGRSEYGCLYPCGEGAGYAGGITSAAMDGIYIAEEIWKRHLI